MDDVQYENLNKKLNYLCGMFDQIMNKDRDPGGSITFYSNKTAIIGTVLQGSELEMTLEAHDGMYHVTFGDSTFTASDVIEARVEVADVLRTDGYEEDTIDMVKNTIEEYWVEPEIFERILESKLC